MTKGDDEEIKKNFTKTKRANFVYMTKSKFVYTETIFCKHNIV